MSTGRKVGLTVALTLAVVLAIAVRLEVHNRRVVVDIRELRTRHVSDDALLIAKMDSLRRYSVSRAAIDSVYMEVRNLTLFVCLNPRLSVQWREELRCPTAR